MYIMRKLLVQAYGRFGDNLCVAGAVSQIKDHEIIIATNEEFKDSVLNIPKGATRVRKYRRLSVNCTKHS